MRKLALITVPLAFAAGALFAADAALAQQTTSNAGATTPPTSATPSGDTATRMQHGQAMNGAGQKGVKPDQDHYAKQNGQMGAQSHDTSSRQARTDTTGTNDKGATRSHKAATTPGSGLYGGTLNGNVPDSGAASPGKPH